MEMQHFSHDHPLLELENTAKEDEETISCAGCRSDVNGPAFGCERCEFYLHKHCAELPLELRHPFHQNDPLKLQFIDPRPESWFLHVCKLCDHYITERRFVYKCNRTCSTDGCSGLQIHVDCALLKPSLRHLYHEHPLVSYKGFGHRVNCAACGAKFDHWHDVYDIYHPVRARFLSLGEARDIIYRCLECGDQFHKECLDMPQVKQVDRHPCDSDLTLCLKPIPEDYEEEKDYYCDGCEEERNVRAFSYVCMKCDFICHMRCDLFENFEKESYEGWVRKNGTLGEIYRDHLDKIEEKIKSLEEELRQLLHEKSVGEECIKRLREITISRSQKRERKEFKIPIRDEIRRITSDN